MSKEMGNFDWQQAIGEIQQELKKQNGGKRRATFAEMEDAVEEQISSIRARMLEEITLREAIDDWPSKPAAERPKCPHCGEALQPRGKHKRRLAISGGEQIELERAYGVCPHCQSGIFPP